MWWKRLGLGAVALACASSAHSSEFVATYSGTVNFGVDSGIFGDAGASLAGQAFTAQIAYDTADAIVDDNPNGLQLDWTGQDAGSSMLAASISIDGTTIPMPASLIRGDVFLDPSLGEISLEADAGASSLQLLMRGLSGTPEIESAYSGTGNGASSRVFFKAGPAKGLNLGLDATSVTIAASTETFPSTVPEPAAWGLMLLGFGGIGAALRRRSPFAIR
jgi:hypothetical protein